MKRRSLTRLRAILAALGAFASIVMPCAQASAQSIVVDDVSGSFPTGPYSALYVDPRQPARVAVGTPRGIVGWAHPRQLVSREARVLHRRMFDVAAMRGDSGRADIGQAEDDEAQALATRPRGLGQTRGPAAAADDPLFGGVPSIDQPGRPSSSFTQHRDLRLPPDPESAAPRLFMQSLEQGVRYARWSFWMSLSEAVTDITDIAVQPSGGRLMVASPAGIYVSDRDGGAWTRTLGGHTPMLRETDPMGMAVTFDPADPARAIASTTEGMFVSEDGGMTFRPHPDRRFGTIPVTRFQWDGQVDGLLFAIADDGILRSDDGGRSFDVAYSGRAMVRGFALQEEGAFVATSEGLEVLVGSETQRLLRGQAIVGVTAWEAGGLLVATATEILHLSPATGMRALARTTERDPFLALAGGPQLAWALTREGVMRIRAGRSEPREHGSENGWRRPRMLLDEAEVERVVIERLGFGDPQDTRLHDRWYAELIPTLNVVVRDRVGTQSSVTVDRFYASLPYSEASASTNDHFEFVLFATWDLSEFMFGDVNVANPNLLIERQLRQIRSDLHARLRERYRLAAVLVRTIARGLPSREEELLARMRLAEHAAYLEALAGREVIEGEEL